MDGRKEGSIPERLLQVNELFVTSDCVADGNPVGVALAAIQGLNQKLESRIEQKKTEITELKARVEKLEQLLQLNTGAQ